MKSLFLESPMLLIQPFRLSFHCDVPSKGLNAATSPRQLPTTTDSPNTCGRSDAHSGENFCCQIGFRSVVSDTTYPKRSELLSRSAISPLAVNVIRPRGSASTDSSATMLPVSVFK